jgi:hypothetical protein
MDLAACDEIGQSQDGLITRRQALRVLTKDQIDELLTQKVWRPLYPGVYRMTGVPNTWLRSVLAATLVNPNALASHHTAAYLFGLVDRRPNDLEFLVKAGKSADLPGVVVHRTRRWFPDMQTVVSGVRSTRVPRTLLELSTFCSVETLGSAVDRALTRRLAGFDELVREFERIGVRSGRKFDVMRSVLSVRDGQFGRVDSVGEADVLAWIKAAGLPMPQEQFRLPVGRHETFRADYAYPRMKIAIEVQSWAWHGGITQYERDAHKEITLAAMGWVVLPVLPRAENREVFLRALTLALESRSAA